jgi:hypothetical protein
MSFEVISLLLNWMEMGVLLAILFRLSSTFELIASTQRELRRAINHLGERRAAELGINNAFDAPGNAFDSSSPHARAYDESTIELHLWPVCRLDSIPERRSMGALSFVSAAGSLPVAVSIRPNIFSL